MVGRFTTLTRLLPYNCAGAVMRACRERIATVFVTENSRDQCVAAILRDRPLQPGGHTGPPLR